MTKQEAIETIKLALSQIEWDYPMDYAVAFDMAISAMEKQDVPDTNVGNMISRQAAIDAVSKGCQELRGVFSRCEENILALPPAQPERKKMSNKEWVDFLSEQFNVSRTSAKEMLHGLMKWKAEDNFKKQFSGGRNEKE